MWGKSKMLNIKYELKKDKRKEQFKPDEPLPYGQLRSDHMFVMDYSNGKWHSPRIIPYGDLKVAPGSVGLEYAQSIFEGSKAFEHPDGELYLFRFDENATRFNNSAKILGMPEIPVEDQMQAVEALVDVERLWFPEQEGAFLYIRPVMFGTSDALAVRESISYTYYVFLSPSGPYFKEGLKPVNILITDKFHRALPSMGKAKGGANYASSILAVHYAMSLGCQQMLYLDFTNAFLEEGGTMNHFQVMKNGDVVIPEFTETILESITSRSIIALQDKLGHKVIQRRISLKEFIEGVKSGEIVETGGLGTAAGVAPFGKYLVDVKGKREELVVNGGQVGPVTKKMYDLLTGIQYGKIPAPKGWMKKVDKVKPPHGG